MKNEEIKRIVVIENDPVLRASAKNHLEKLDQVVVEIYSSAEDCLTNMMQDPELILLDFSLETSKEEGMNGHEALNHFRMRNSAQKIIFVSGRLDFELLEEYKQYRAIDYIEKSRFISNRMIEKVKHQLFAA